MFKVLQEIWEYFFPPDPIKELRESINKLIKQRNLIVESAKDATPEEVETLSTIITRIDSFIEVAKERYKKVSAEKKILEEYKKKGYK